MFQSVLMFQTHTITVYRLQNERSVQLITNVRYNKVKETCIIVTLIRQNVQYNYRYLNLNRPFGTVNRMVGTIRGNQRLNGGNSHISICT